MRYLVGSERLDLLVHDRLVNELDEKLNYFVVLVAWRFFDHLTEMGLPFWQRQYTFIQQCYIEVHIEQVYFFHTIKHPLQQLLAEVFWAHLSDDECDDVEGVLSCLEWVVEEILEVVELLFCELPKSLYCVYLFRFKYLLGFECH